MIEWLTNTDLEIMLSQHNLKKYLVIFLERLKKIMKTSVKIVSESNPGPPKYQTEFDYVV
jgi:hypothetical protein